MEPQKIDTIGYLLIFSLLILLSYAGYLSYKSIDFQVLEKLEKSTLVLPTPIIATPSAQTSTNSTKAQ